MSTDKTHDSATYPAIPEIASVLEAIAKLEDGDAARAFHEVSDQSAVKAVVQRLREGDLSGFDQHLSRPFETMARGLLAHALPGREAAWFLIMNRRFVETHFRWVIERKEGFCCCADKTRAIVRRLFRLLAEDKPIVFDPQASVTFHHPTTVFTTQESIVEFFQGVHRLYHGNPDGYLAILRRILFPNSRVDTPPRGPSS